MGHINPNSRRTVTLVAGLSALVFGCSVQAALASFNQDHAAAPVINGDLLALSDTGETVPDNKPEGKLLIPATEPEITVPPVTTDDETPEDKLETNVSDDKDHSNSQANVSVNYDLSKLPKPVERMRELIVEAATKGDIEGLRPLLGTGNSRTQLSIGGYDGDPIEFLKEISGDGNGRELLAILLDIFQTGYAQLDAGEPTEMYLWPYFYSVPIDSLDDRQMVELYRIITAGDYEDMVAFGGYIFYRTAITPDGQWKFFVAGD